MLFSVLIANYNNARYLDVALQSVISQTYTNWEIILVDDASTDDVSKVLQKYKTDSRINIYQNAKNFGCGYTKGRCAKLATGEILGFLDPDDALHPGALQTMVNAHISKPQCSLIHSTHYICDAKLEVNRIAEYPRALPKETPYLLVSDGRIHHFATFKRSAYLKTEGLCRDNHKAVDQDLYYLLEEVGEILFINQPLYYYRIHQGGISTTGNEAETTKWHYSIIEKACLRRIKTLKISTQTNAHVLIQMYTTRLCKIRIFKNFRNKAWLNFIYNLIQFPFVGGAQNLISYAKKLPKEGASLIKKSFVVDHKIKVE
ncbi:MAG: glycosyltransferase [Sphingobacteriales bacterium]|nr:MAG: glycosyltransferase [Sphingobacteriales bacterium]